jgi:hypothetical protein
MMARRNVSREINGIGEQPTVLRQDLNVIAEQVQTLVQQRGGSAESIYGHRDCRRARTHCRHAQPL